MARFLSRPERLAEARRKARQAAITDPPRLNPDYPYRALGFDPVLFQARRVGKTES
jgi:hypothetical protein